MLKSELIKNTDAAVEETRVALQIVYDCLNKGQQKQIVKHEEVTTLFDRYGVKYGGVE